MNTLKISKSIIIINYSSTNLKKDTPSKATGSLIKHLLTCYGIKTTHSYKHILLLW